jgi:hypothetical protein
MTIIMIYFFGTIIEKLIEMYVMKTFKIIFKNIEL